MVESWKPVRMNSCSRLEDCTVSSTSWLSNQPQHSRRLMAGREHQDLLERRDALAHPIQSHHPQRAHALSDRDLAHLTGVCAGNNHLAQFIRDGHGFNNRQTARITGILATVTTAASKESHPIEDARVNRKVLVHLCWVG